MSIYFQRERKNLEQSIDADGIVLFDVAIQSSETTPLAEDPLDPPLPSEADFDYHQDGTIDIFRASTYIVGWNLSSVSGMSTDGQVFQLKRRDYEAEELDPLAGEVWTAIGSGTSAFKMSASSGMSTLLISEQEIHDHGKATIALFNISDAPIKLSKHPHAKAGILMFGIGPIDSDITDIYRYVQELYEFISYSDVYIYTTKMSPFHSGVGPAGGTQVPLSSSPSHQGSYQVGVIWSGYTYNFWLISPDPNTRSISLPANVKTYLLQTSDFEPLGWYQGQTTFGTMWCLGSNGNYTPLPVMFDHDGIYVTPTNNSFSSLANVKFTQTLILTPPNSSPIPLPSP